MFALRSRILRRCPPKLIDFGTSALGSKTDAREVTLHSPDPTARLGRIVSENTKSHDVQTAEDGKSFRFCLQPDETGRISSVVNVEVLLGNGEETVHRSVSLTVQSEQAVFATPSQVSMVMSGKAQEYTILVEHVGNEPLQIVSLSHDDAIQSHFERETYQVTQEVGLTLLSEIGRKQNSSVAIHGRTQRGDAFALTVPVSVISLAKTRGGHSLPVAGETP